MFNENDEEVVETAEEVADNTIDNEDNSTEESDGETTAQTTNERAPETPEAKRARLKRQLDQLDKKHGFKDEEPAKNSGTEDDRYTRLELKTEGIKDKKEQDRVIKLAKALEMDVIDALATPAVQAELKAMRAKSATPSPSTRTGGGQTDDVAYWAAQTQKGKSAPTPELRSKVRQYLATH